MAEVQEKRSLEAHFSPFKKNIVGDDAEFDGPYGKKKILYADWTASGRLYRPIEEKLLNEIGPLVANTHTETSYTGQMMTHAYHDARDIIKKHINANEDDVMLPVGTGMTGAVVKFQRLLGLTFPERVKPFVNIPDEECPVVFISHMEHHSNQTSWLETVAHVEIIRANDEGLMDLSHLDELLQKHIHRKVKIASITSCSNVTGVKTPYFEVAEIMHRAGGLCFVDFACSGPYVEIDMHPENPLQVLDAIFFSPHKFLGGPGTPGILAFNRKLYKNRVPDAPGGGTVSWTNPWGEHAYFEDIETREDGGTPGFLQTIKAALAIRLKEEMGVGNILAREAEINKLIFERLKKIEGLHLLAGNVKERLGVYSFYVEGMHYNLGVKLLNDHFGIQVRGGCSCAGTYGHYLLNVSPEISHDITCRIDQGDLSMKPGWVRMSIHPTMTDDEVEFICDAIESVVKNHEKWGNDYEYCNRRNDYIHKSWKNPNLKKVEGWFGVKKVDL